MPTQPELASQVQVKLDGAEVQQAVMTKLASATVDQHTHMPGMFALHFLDPNMEILDNGPFDLTKEVEISADTQGGDRVVLIKGEITSLEPEFREGMIAELVVRGYDKSHRLYRETKSTAHVNAKDSDLATQIASNADLQAEVDATSAVYEHLFQHNQSDMAFLMQRAWRIGYECFVADGKLYFRRPPSGSATVRLTWGDDLLTFRPRMTLAEQVDEVFVRGWDPENQTPIVGHASSGNLYPQVGESRDGAGWAHNFGAGKIVIVDQPVISQAEADALATARLDEISGAFIDAEGEAIRRPDITAGKAVELSALGNRLSGTYLVTSATHTISPEGLKTVFTVRGSRTGLLSEQVNHKPPLDRWAGVVTAVVTNTDDPKDVGRVKLKFPWMTEDAESDWARVIGIGAGKDTGLYVMPKVGDEVLVAFAYGDFSQPFVLGGLWSAINTIPPEAQQAANGEKPLVRTWHSTNGNIIAVYDNADKKIEILTADGRSVTLNDNDRKLTLKTSQVTVTMEDDKLTIEAGTEINIKAGSNMKLEANGNLDIKASGTLTVQSSSVTNIKGSMVNLN